MAVTVTQNLTLVDAAESTTGWTADNGWSNLGAQSIVVREGTNALEGQTSQGAGHIYHTLDASADLTATANRRVYAWVVPPGSFDTIANGGLRIVLGDGTNRVAYYVGGNDATNFVVGAWIGLMLDVNNLPTNFATLAGSEASLDATAITEIGIGVNNAAKAVGNSPNTFADVIRYGTGLTITGGTTGDPGLFSEIAADDASTAAGKAHCIIRQIQSGVFGIQGDLIFGDNAGTATTHFEDTDAVIIIEDHVHGTGTPTTIDIQVVGNATGTTHFELGLAVGSGDDETGSNGVQFRNANTSQTAQFLASDPDLQDLLLFGLTLLGLPQGATFSSDATNGITHRLSGCAFDQNGQVDVGRTVVRNSSFSGYSLNADGALLWNENIDIKNCDFFANTDATNDPAAVEHPSAVGSPYTYDNLVFSSNDFDINNTSGSAITIAAVNGANPSTSKGSSVTINNSVTLEITTVDVNNDPVSGARVGIFTDDANETELMNELTDASGVASTTFNYSTDQPIFIRVRHASGDPAYEDVETTGTITIDGFTLQVTLIEDPNV